MLRPIVYLFFFFISISYSQNHSNSQDPLQASDDIKSFIKTSDSIKRIKKIIKKTLLNDTISYIAYNKTFLQRGIDEENYKYQYYAAYRLGHIYNLISDYPQSIAYTKAAKEASRHLQDTIKDIRSSLLNAANYYELDLYEESLKLYIEVREQSQNIHRKDYEFLVLPSIANIRIALKKYEEALKVYNTTLEILAKQSPEEMVGYQQALLSALLGKGKCQKHLGDFDEALYTYQEGITLAKEYQSIKHLIDFQTSIGNTYYRKGEYTKAIKYLIDAKKSINSQYKKYPNITQANYFLALCYTAQNQFEEAIKLLESNFATIQDKQQEHLLKEMYELRVKIAQIQQDLQTETLYQKHIIDLVDRKNEKRISTLELLHNNDTQEYQNLNNQLVIKNDKINSQKKTAILIVIILVLILIYSFFYYTQKNKAKARRFQEIIKKIQDHYNTTPETTPKSHIKDTRAQEILERLSDLEKTEFFKSKECTLHTTAKAIETNTTYLSKALNEVKKQSFSQYLNELRIDYVLVTLKEDTRFRSYTIKAISEEIGYKSVTTFLKAFKGRTNLNPSYYIEKLNVTNSEMSSDL